ncbi:DUF805 domain-containing protein [Bosea sp. 2KB_26]|uniref:DUF805 domain-containing protein n=1 Tax=Bosea sp. 2KB_26 TaxID=3237475 RepID=UPI003F8F5632
MPLLTLLTGFEGRIGRAAFWSGTTLVAVALVLADIGSVRLGGVHGPEITAFAGTFALFPWSALAAKRGRDRGRSWYYGPTLVIAIVLSGLGPDHFEAAAAKTLGAFSLLLWLVALIDLGLLPGCNAPVPVAETQADAKPAE